MSTSLNDAEPKPKFRSFKIDRIALVGEDSAKAAVLYDRKEREAARKRARAAARLAARDRERGRRVERQRTIALKLANKARWERERKEADQIVRVARRLRLADPEEFRLRKVRAEIVAKRLDITVKRVYRVLVDRRA